MRPAFLTGAGMTSFANEGRSLKELVAEACRDALADAEISLDEIDAIFYANSLAGVIEGQECIRGEVAMWELGLANVPLTNVENACASGGTALHLARSSVSWGQYNTVLAIGAERMRVPDKAKTFTALAGAMDVDDLDVSIDLTRRSPFIDVYAARARRLITDNGVTRFGLARIAAKAWCNGAMNPKAQRRTRTSPSAVLRSRDVVDPLTVDMCALTADGAAAAVVSSRRRPKRDVLIRASQVRTASANETDPTAISAAAKAAYGESGVGPGDVHVVEVHDATAPGEMLAWTGLMLCQPGDEELWAQTGHTEPAGALPVNLSGGLIARGHPIAASGLAQAYEVARQLRGEAGARQAPHPTIALTQVGGGILDGTKTAVAAVHIFSRE